MVISEQLKKRLQNLAGIKKKILAYHGTPHDFDKFKLKKSGSQNNAGDFGKGLYFSTDKDVAKTYANDSGGFVLTVELFVENPYIIDYEKFSKFEMEQSAGKLDRNLVNPEVQKYIDVLKNGGGDFVLSDVKNKDNRKIDFLSISDMFGAKEISDCLENEGYDAVVVKYGSGNEIVVFDDKQTKIVKKEQI